MTRVVDRSWGGGRVVGDWAMKPGEEGFFWNLWTSG